MSDNSQLVCPNCGATRFERHDIVEFTGKREKTIRTLYVCQNGMCGRVSEKDALTERVMETILLESDD